MCLHAFFLAAYLLLAYNPLAARLVNLVLEHSCKDAGDNLSLFVSFWRKKLNDGLPKTPAT